MQYLLQSTIIHNSNGGLEATHYVEDGVLIEMPLTINAFENGIHKLGERFPANRPCTGEKEAWFNTFIDMGMTSRMFEHCIDYLTESFTHCCPIDFPSLQMVFDAISHLKTIGDSNDKG